MFLLYLKLLIMLLQRSFMHLSLCILNLQRLYLGRIFSLQDCFISDRFLLINIFNVLRFHKYIVNLCTNNIQNNNSIWNFESITSMWTKNDDIIGFMFLKLLYNPWDIQDVAFYCSTYLSKTLWGIYLQSFLHYLLTNIWQ